MEDLKVFLELHWIWILTWPLWAPVSMYLLYVIWAQHYRGGLWTLCEYVGVIGYPYDVLLQHTLFQLYFWEIAPPGEATISMRVFRLKTAPGWRGSLARFLARLMNSVSKVPHV